jgi:DNA-binding beta-propeller fold protein YncE
VRALLGPGPFLGSNGIALSPEGRHVYIASSGSDAIAIFARDSSSGKLTQPAGTGGCIAAGGAGGCATASGLDGPNSVAVSADGKNVYATSVDSDAVAIFSRDSSTGALTQAGDGTGCISNADTPGCTTGRALDGADVVTISPDGKSVYVGAFFGNAVAIFGRDSSSGDLTQPADASGCITDAATDGCATGEALRAPEGMAVSADGKSVYVAAAVSNALDVFSRDGSTGALTQMGRASGRELLGANAVAISPDDDNVYVTSLFSNSLTSFKRGTSGGLTQLKGTSACVKDSRAVGCSLGHGLSQPEGLTVALGGASVYAAAFGTGAVDTFTRDADSGAVVQKPAGAGCVGKAGNGGCLRGHSMHGVGGVATSPDGKFVYATASKSDAVGVFKLARKKRGPGQTCPCLTQRR